MRKNKKIKTDSRFETVGELTKSIAFNNDQIKMIRHIISSSDAVVIELFKFIKKTLDEPTKNQITLYRQTLMSCINVDNDDKYKYLFRIIAKTIDAHRDMETKEKVVSKNEVLVNPSLFSISWENIQDNIKNNLSDQDVLSVENIQKAYEKEQIRLQNLYDKLDKLVKAGIVISEQTKDSFKNVYLKLTDLVNIFMLESFQDTEAMIQEVEIFDKQYDINVDSPNSLYLDSNFKNIINIADPKNSGDAVNKKYVDDQIQQLFWKIKRSKE